MAIGALVSANARSRFCASVARRRVLPTFMGSPDRRVLLARPGVVLLMVSIPVAALVAYDSDAVLAMLGKDSSLTGRTELWAYLLTRIAEAGPTGP